MGFRIWLENLLDLIAKHAKSAKVFLMEVLGTLPYAKASESRPSPSSAAYGCKQFNRTHSEEDCNHALSCDLKIYPKIMHQNIMLFSIMF